MLEQHYLFETKDPVMLIKTENEDLNLHTQLCAERYRQLEQRMEAFDERLVKVEAQISSIKMELSKGISEIRLLIEQQNNARSRQIIASAGAICVAIISLIGYIVLHKY